ncbi:MAG: phenylacetate--CoA ligase [Deltaproteobacteria bacterium]|jgi:phenylacetate-CoA ligase|nr:phenylacetate--CoA ligase [Deltaproteobacteria bacterium]
MIYDPAYETMPRAELEKLQLERLKDLIALCRNRVPFYANKFKEIGFQTGDLKTAADLSLLPFTEKDDLRNNYPHGLSAVPQEDIVRFHASSGTTGKITVVGYTANDLKVWAHLMARSLTATGLSRSDVINVAYGYGLFTGGLGAHYGAELLGAAVVPCSSGSSVRQIRLMSDLRVTGLCCTPTYALYLSEVAKKEGLDFRDKSRLPLKVGVFGAEPWSDSMCQTIEETMAINAMNIYGLSEIMGPAVSIECLESRVGLHIFEDHFLPEIIDPNTGQILGPGQEGELVLTTLTKEGTPLLRYRTRDITSLIEEPCPCGRTHRRMSRLRGRSDDMLIIKGINVYPSQIETLILDTDGFSPNYQIIVDRDNNLDTLEVCVEAAEPLYGDAAAGLTRVLSRKIKDNLTVEAKVTIIPDNTVPRGQGKTQRVFDKRQKI